MIALTGATGFLGGHIASALRAGGVSVRGVVRRPEAATGLDEVACADLGDRGALARAFAGCRVVVANAALGSSDSPLERYLAVNRDGAVHVVQAAAAVGVRRVVLVSTTAVYRTRLLRPMTEAAEPYGTRRRRLNPSDLTTDWRYALSKALGERAARQHARALGVDLVVLRPGPVYGSGDTRTTSRYLAWLDRRWVLLPTVGVPQVHAGDVALAVRAAVDAQGVVGHAFNLAGPPTTPVQVVRTLSRLSGRGPRVVPLPLPLWVAYDTSAAERALGFANRSLEAGLAEVLGLAGGGATGGGAGRSPHAGDTPPG